MCNRPQPVLYRTAAALCRECLLLPYCQVWYGTHPPTVSVTQEGNYHCLIRKLSIGKQIYCETGHPNQGGRKICRI
jgi:hypothetical protein